MRIAWFRPDDSPRGLADVVDGLAGAHAVERVSEAAAHDFVWQHARGWFDLCVYELDNTASHQYMWPYLLNYAGVLALQTATVHDARRARLVHEGRLADYAAEAAFAGGPRHIRPPWHLARGRWPMLRIPVSASLATAVADDLVADDLERTFSDARIRHVVPGVVGPLPGVASDAHARPPGTTAAEVGVVCTEPSRRAVVERSVARVRADGVPLTLREGDAALTGDIVVALRWPLDGQPLVSALAAMAAGAPVVEADTHHTALWPALDPQTWQLRGGERTAAPTVVSIDPRDEEHSLVLALRRLGTDSALRAQLGGGARAWWETHATIERAVESWLPVLNEALTAGPPARPTGWPAHLQANGSALVQRLLTECGATLPAP